MRLISCVLVSVFLLYPFQLFAITSDAQNAQGLHLDWLNKKVAPGKNFFKFANGNWQKMNPIPAAYSSWGSFHVLEEQNEELIHKLLEAASTNTHSEPGSEEQKMGDLYFSGMDEQAIDNAGIKPLQAEFDRINGMTDFTDLQKLIAHLQMIGVTTPFAFNQMQDYDDSQNVIGVASQSGLGLPDRDYYLKNEPKFQQIRQTYIQYITKMFELLGDSSEKATAEANVVMQIETTLAKASMSRIEERDPHAVYHIMNLAQLNEATPHFSWEQYFADIEHPEIKQINLAMPEFFKVMDAELKNTSLDEWKTYFRWHLIQSYGSLLSKPFVNENFRMHAALTGAKEILPRWKRVVSEVNYSLGFAVGKLYVAKAFPPYSKQQVQEILNNIRTALKNDLQTLSWMTPKTRQAALLKLDLMEERIGYPDKWRDYSALKIDRGPYALNQMRATEFLNKREWNKIGKPLDKTEWEMTPQTVNAYYSPSTNRLNMPAGILQPPFFDPSAPAAVNYGSIGFVMGHEMTHGFDDQGAQFDGHGNLKNWWTPDDLKKFQTTTDHIANQFSNYTVAGKTHIQGKLVIGEAAADLGGLTLAYRAFHRSDTFKQAKSIHGFTPDQQFFLGAAHIWAINVRPDEARRLVIIDPHPPGKYRVNGTLANIPEFQQAFNIAANSKMVNQNRGIIW